MSRRKRGAPTPDDLRLWREVTETVAPLGRRPKVEPKPDVRSGSEPAPEPAPTSLATPAPAARPVAKPQAPPLSPIDRRTVTRLGRGSVGIDARIDLHGLTQAAAHGRLVRFLKEAQADGARMVLVITGKGRPAEDDGFGGRAERGVLRRAVPLWLGSAELRPFVVGFGEAGPTHGGTGALYVRIRRERQRT